MPNTNPCPTCHAQLDPGTPHTFCARTKEPKARELEIQLRALAGVLIPRLEALERGPALDAAFARGLAEALKIRVEALERAKENTGAALGDGSERQPSDSHGQHEEPGRSDPLVEGQRSSAPVAVDPYKLTDEEREELSNSMFDGWDAMDHGSAVNAAQEWIESLVTRAVRDTIQHGGGLERNATPREGRCPSPAASALPMPERPKQLDKMAAFLDVEDGYAQQYLEDARDAARYALSLESRLAESNKHRNEYAESNLRTASKLADMSEAFARERADHAALKAKLAEAEKQVEEERQSHLGASHAWAEAADERDRRQKRIEEITIERDAFKEMLSSERKAKLAQVARVCADRDALKAKLAEAVAVAGDAIGTDPTQRSTGCVDALAGHYRIVCEDRDALRAKLEASEYEVRRLQVVANEDRAVSDAIRGERERLRAKLDGVREALSDAISTVGGARRSCVGDHYIHSPQVRLDQVDRWRSALAAAENTGDAGRTPAGQCSTDRSTDGQPPTSTEPAVDEPGPVTNPAVSHPSPATAFELTDDQGNELYEAADGNYLCAHVEKLVNSELRKAREGWVTREVAERALEQCALEYISGSSVHANAKDYLTAAIRAASKEASDGTR